MPTVIPFQLTPSVIATVKRMLDAKGQDWVRLNSLYCLKACSSLYRAAKMLKLSGVRSVRKRIKKLEKDLDLVLIITDGTGSKITPAGHALIVLIEPYLNNAIEA